MQKKPRRGETLPQLLLVLIVTTVVMAIVISGFSNKKPTALNGIRQDSIAKARSDSIWADWDSVNQITRAARAESAWRKNTSDSLKLRPGTAAEQQKARDNATR